jgi:hypothetical protein
MAGCLNNGATPAEANIYTWPTKGTMATSNVRTDALPITGC